MPNYGYYDSYDPSRILSLVGAYAACIIVFAFVMFALMVVGYWKVLEKAGYNGVWSLLLLVPGLNGIASLCILLFLAFSDWPALRRPTGMVAPVGYPPASGASPAYVPPAPPPTQPTYAPPPPPMSSAEAPVAPAYAPPAPTAPEAAAPSLEPYAAAPAGPPMASPAAPPEVPPAPPAEPDMPQAPDSDVRG